MSRNKETSQFEAPDYEFICKLVGHLYIENINLQRKELPAHPSRIEEILKENQDLKSKVSQLEKDNAGSFGMGREDNR